ncbi:MAG: hypothetical protein JW900_05170 [Anaerolineae bacterium]|nr:hypothetical protein [Anaerolineae bacterium]
MSDNHTSDFERRLRERIDRHKDERAQASQELFGQEPEGLAAPPDLSGLPFDEAVAAYDDWVERRVRAWRGEAQLEPPAPPAPEPLPAPPPQEREPGRRGRVQPIHQLEDMDRLMVDSFAIDEFMPRAVTGLPPLVACETLDEFAAPLGDFLPGYRRRLFPRWLDQVRQNRGQVRPGNPLSYLALQLPWRASYVNGWQLMAAPQAGLQAALQDRQLLRRAVQALAAERWGHGFIERYAAWGYDIHTLGLDGPCLIQRLELPPPDDPRMAQMGALAEGALLTTTGWSLWVGEYLAQRARPATGPGPQQQPRRLRLSQLWDALRRLFRVVPLETWAQILGTPFPGIDQLVQGVSETLNWLLMNTDMDGRMINWSVRRAQRMATALEAQGREVAGISLRESLARLLISSVEANLGVMPIPYAVLMAANLDFDADWDAGEIRRWLDGDARQNVDARLVMLTRLDRSVKHNVSSLVSAAVHTLGLQPPEELEWT